MKNIGSGGMGKIQLSKNTTSKSMGIACLCSASLLMRFDNLFEIKFVYSIKNTLEIISEINRPQKSLVNLFDICCDELMPKIKKKINFYNFVPGTFVLSLLPAFMTSLLYRHLF